MAKITIIYYYYNNIKKKENVIGVNKSQQIWDISSQK